jgi:hypothetical protein
MFIIHLQAAYPDTNAATNATYQRKQHPVNSLGFHCNRLHKIGSNYRYNYHQEREPGQLVLAVSKHARPVEIVDPDLDNPGKTASAWAIPIRNAPP